MTLDDRLRSHLRAHSDRVAGADGRLTADAVMGRARRAARRRRIAASTTVAVLLVLATLGGWALTRSGDSGEPDVITSATPSPLPSPSTGPTPATPTPGATPGPTSSPTTAPAPARAEIAPIGWTTGPPLPAVDTSRIVAWGEGLLRIDAVMADGVLRMSESADGATWADRPALPLPTGTTWVFTLEALDGRLYVLSAAEPARRLAVTTDLTTWDAVVDLPAPTDLGWPDTAAVLPELTDVAVHGEDIVVVGSVVRSLSAGEDPTEIPAAGSSPQAIAWSGTLDGGFEAQSVVRGGFGPRVASAGDGFVLFTPGPGGVVGLASSDGRTWQGLELPAQPQQLFVLEEGLRGAIVLAWELDGGIVGYVVGGDGTVVATADTSGLTAADVELNLTPVASAGTAGGAAAALLSGTEVGSEPSFDPVVLTDNTYELTLDLAAQTGPLVELRRLDDGTLVGTDPASHGFSPDGLEIRDPSGEVLFTASADEVSAAMMSGDPENPEIPATHRLVATTVDGTSWQLVGRSDITRRIESAVRTDMPVVELFGMLDDRVHVRFGDDTAVLPVE